MNFMPATRLANSQEVDPDFSWEQIARLVFTSRVMDDIEENELYPKKLVPYQFSARGHELCQILLGSLLTHPLDVVSAYYRSRPILLSLGLTPEDGFAVSMAKSGGYSDGRDIGAVCNLPSLGKATAIPMAGDVGSQYTPAAGSAQAIEYRRTQLDDKNYENAIAVAMGGEGSVATNGFWSALTIATTLKLPLLFFIEDNGYAISVTSEKQTPGGNIAKNLASFGNLTIIDKVDGTNPTKASAKIKEAVNFVRTDRLPLLIRVTVPRLSGHSGQDTQAYKPNEFLEYERANDPLRKLENYLVPNFFSESSWQDLKSEVEREVRGDLQKALNRADPDETKVQRHLFFEPNNDGKPAVQIMGGLAAERHEFPASNGKPQPGTARVNMVEAIRRTLEFELKTNPKLLVFGEDVGQKGGVHAATLGLQKEFGKERVFDTSLSEEGIVGRAVGMALNGLMPVVEIQFRKYADPATEQLNNCGTIRWRTNNRFAAPIVVRIPGGFAKCGDPWHSLSNEVLWAHGMGWQVAVPSNAEDAAGLLRAAMRSNNPTIFFEHRSLLDAPWARRPYPGDHFVLPIGRGRFIQEGSEITIVSWGAMVERCEKATKLVEIGAEIIDLRTVSPWDKEAVLNSVKKTRRCLIVHEDNITAGFGAEIAASLAKEAFYSLDAPIERLAPPDIPIPYNVPLMNSILPDVERIADKIVELVEF
jgi:2-oxoisovalerate dehydrogenase E1 component